MKAKNDSDLNPGARGLWPALLIALVITLLPNAESKAAADQDKTAQEVAGLFRAARKVISDNQTLINDAEKGDKGLSADAVVAKAKEHYQSATGQAVNEASEASKAVLAAVTEVMNEAQPLINEKGKGFKGFLPAVFARQVAEKTSTKLSGKLFIKLTAPKDYLRNRANRPDDWENHVIEAKFRSGTWEKGKLFAESAEHKGKKGYRLALPEYYGQSCLSCHGEPKGEHDITGGSKEGAKLDELGGMISVVVYDN